MKKLLQRTESSYYIYLSKTILKLMGIIPNKTKALINIDGEKLIISKVEKSENPDGCYIKNIAKLGSGYCIFITKTMLELINVDPVVDMVDITIENKSIIVKRA